MNCSDCGGPTPAIREATLKRGSNVRDPGEAVCPSCSSSRMRMVRELMNLPAKLDLIKAMRMAR